MVHKRKLKLIGEIGYGADSTDDEECVYLLGKVYNQLIPYRNMDIVIVGSELLHHVKALLHREHIFFLRIYRDDYLHLVKELGGPVYYVEMPIGDRIEGSRENYFLHMLSYREYNIKNEIIQPSKMHPCLQSLQSPCTLPQTCKSHTGQILTLLRTVTLDYVLLNLFQHLPRGCPV